MILRISLVCCTAWAIVCSGRSSGRRSATQRPFGAGGNSAGQRSKKAADEGRRIVWIDQSGFYLLPHQVRTWARCRQTPVLKVPLTRDHRSAIGALSSDGRLFLRTQPGAYHSTEVVGFLRVLLRKISGKL